MTPFLEIRGFTISFFALPFTPVYYVLKFLEMLVQAVSPVYKINLPSESYTVKYLNIDLYFSRNKAEKELGYRPIFTPRIAMEKSLPYYRDLKLWKNVMRIKVYHNH